MDPPRVTKVMMMFPLKYGCYIISIIGLTTALIAIVLVIFYSLVDIIMAQLQRYKADDSVKKAIMVILVVNALLLACANGFLLAGTFFNKASAYELSAYMLLVMISTDIVIIAAGPVACFLTENGCTVLRNSSYIVQVALMLGMMIHLDIWSYYMICVFSASEHRRYQ